MARRSAKKRPLEESREKLRQLMASAALFILIAGLVLVIFLILDRGEGSGEAMLAFSPFFLSGLVLLAASAMIDVEIVKVILNAWNPLKAGGKS